MRGVRKLKEEKSTKVKTSELGQEKKKNAFQVARDSTCIIRRAGRESDRAHVRVYRREEREGEEEKMLPKICQSEVG